MGIACAQWNLYLWPLEEVMYVGLWVWKMIRLGRSGGRGQVTSSPCGHSGWCPRGSWSLPPLSHILLRNFSNIEPSKSDFWGFPRQLWVLITVISKPNYFLISLSWPSKMIHCKLLLFAVCGDKSKRHILHQCWYCLESKWHSLYADSYMPLRLTCAHVLIWYSHGAHPNPNKSCSPNFSKPKQH